MIASAEAGKRVLVEMDDVARLADALAGVRRTAPQGLAEWRYHGRLDARQLDDAHLVIRADIAHGEAGAIEDALEAAWQLQRSAD